jgi:type II secretory pathway pseudopilin PulG
VRGRTRAAFTLVELLVVIAIIIVLASLLLAAVFKALDLANQAATRTDVTQLAGAVEAFRNKYQVGYPPSRIILCKDYLNYFNNRDPRQGALTLLHQDSLDYLTTVFPRITTPPGQALPQWALPPFPAWAGSPQPGNIYTGIDWNSTGQPDQLTPYVLSCPFGNAQILGSVLEGEQCLVFFTGGIPGNGTMNGFSRNASNPAAGGDRVPPFFDFKSNRLHRIQGTADGFPCYFDGYGKTPYAYFSSYKSANGYNRYINYSNPYIPPIAGSPITSDCQALSQYSSNGFPVFPYAQSGMYSAPQATPGANPVYLAPQTYQLISAGKNSNFGNGTVIQGYPGFPAGNQVWVSNFLWNPSNATSFYPQGSDGYDDIANFYDRLLGVPTQ